METHFTLFIITAGAALIGAIVYASRKTKNDPGLKEHYEQCLKGTDKKAALIAGRAYNQSLRRNGQLIIYDELAIAKDLNAMSWFFTDKHLHFEYIIQPIK